MYDLASLDSWYVGGAIPTFVNFCALGMHLECSSPPFSFPWWLRWLRICLLLGFRGGSAGEESACNAGDLGLTSGVGISPGEGNGYPPQYSGLEKSMDCMAHVVAKSRTRLSDFHFHFLSLLIHHWLFQNTCLSYETKHCIVSTFP